MGAAQGGVLFVRPCAAVMRHMIELAASDPLLQFRECSAEQDFIDYYFKYQRYVLPIEYNAIAHLLVANGTMTWAGTRPRIVHFTNHKPFTKDPSKPGHNLLCKGN